MSVWNYSWNYTSMRSPLPIEGSTTEMQEVQSDVCPADHALTVSSLANVLYCLHSKGEGEWVTPGTLLHKALQMHISLRGVFIQRNKSFSSRWTCLLIVLDQNSAPMKHLLEVTVKNS